MAADGAGDASAPDKDVAARLVSLLPDAEARLVQGGSQSIVRRLGGTRLVDHMLALALRQRTISGRLAGRRGARLVAQAHGEGDALALEVDLQHLDLHDVARLHHLAR